jgi:hypothetical protein
MAMLSYFSSVQELKRWIAEQVNSFCSVFFLAAKLAIFAAIY